MCEVQMGRLCLTGMAGGGSAAVGTVRGWADMRLACGEEREGEKRSGEEKGDRETEMVRQRKRMALERTVSCAFQGAWSWLTSRAATQEPGVKGLAP